MLDKNTKTKAVFSLYRAGSAIMAPIAGHTDVAFRKMIRRHGCPYAFTEMIDAGSLAMKGEKTIRLAQRGTDSGFLGIQLVGSDLTHLAMAIEQINNTDFQVVDFNLGCPAPKVERKCEGIELALKNPEAAVRAVALLVEKSRLPVTVKTRIQSEEDSSSTVSFCLKLQNVGVSAITIHGRVKKNFYSGIVYTNIISDVRENLSIPVIANGGVFSRKDFLELLQKTGCSCGMIARGALGNPWIFKEIIDSKFEAPTVNEFADEILCYMNDMLEVYGKKFAYVVARKTLLEFLKGRGYPGSLRASISSLCNHDDLLRLIDTIRLGPSASYWDSLERNEMQRRLRRG